MWNILYLSYIGTRSISVDRSPIRVNVKLNTIDSSREYGGILSIDLARAVHNNPTNTAIPVRVILYGFRSMVAGVTVLSQASQVS